MIRVPEELTAPRMSVADACDAFMKDCEARNLSKATRKKYDLLTRELKGRFKENIAAVTPDDIRAYREAWGMVPLSALKKLERLNTFFRFCDDAGWIRENPTRVIRSPKIVHRPTLPFTKEEMEKIVWATEVYPTAGIHGMKNPLRAKAMVLLLRYSGMRVGDVATLACEKIQNGQLLLYTAKTNTPVSLPLPKDVLRDLADLGETGKYFFWSGNGGVKAATSGVQRTLAKVFKLAKVSGHAHKFRDTFAVELLQNGVSLENVAALLGNTIKVAERHYAPWVKSRQEALTAEIEKAWKLA